MNTWSTWCLVCKKRRFLTVIEEVCRMSHLSAMQGAWHGSLQFQSTQEMRGWVYLLSPVVWVLPPFHMHTSVQCACHTRYLCSSTLLLKNNPPEPKSFGIQYIHIHRYAAVIGRKFGFGFGLSLDFGFGQLRPEIEGRRSVVSSLGFFLSRNGSEKT